MLPVFSSKRLKRSLPKKNILNRFDENAGSKEIVFLYTE